MQSHAYGHEPGERHREWLPDSGVDALQPVIGWVDMLGGRPEGPAEPRFFVLRQSVAHVSRSRTVRSVAMALAV
jgi:hypothetical protein